MPQQEKSDGVRDRKNERSGFGCCVAFPRLESFSEKVRGVKFFRGPRKRRVNPNPLSYVPCGGRLGTLNPPSWVHTPEVAPSGPPRPVADKGKNPPKGGVPGGGRRRCPACGEFEVKVGGSARGFSATFGALVSARRGHFGACVRPPPPKGPGLVPNPLIRNSPLPPGGSDRLGDGDGGSPARGDQLLTPSRHVSLHSSGGHWGPQVSGAGAYCLGGLGPLFPTLSSRLHPRQSHVFPGGHAHSWEPSPVRGFPGEMSPTKRVHLHSPRRAAKSTIAQGMQGPSPGPSHLPAPLSPPSVCGWKPQTPHKTHFAPGNATSRTCRENVDRAPGKGSWSTLGALCLPWAHAATEMRGPPHQSPPTAPTQSPPASKSTSFPPSTFFDEVKTTVGRRC
ncbi:hypothetical protein GWK47_044338 [Chionoecetes opilio]|uniref:Uncharacterized protein n=1 Tax=Chionoecetes opilio TaxID=41210 RepID=A0A8J4YJB9_CHIOP|nr:hypothetical protein GWK47_044338 [Chionoecetes opilio]